MYLECSADVWTINENSFLGLTTTIRVKKCPKLSESPGNLGKSYNVFEYFLVRGGYVRRKQVMFNN